MDRRPLRSPARAGRWRRRIAERDQIARRLDTARTAAGRVGEALRDARARVEAAKAAAADATDAHAEALLGGQIALADRPMRRVRAGERDAEADIAAARGAPAKVEASIGEYEAELRRAERRVENAIAEIMASAIDGVIAKAETSRRELDDEHAVLSFLAHSSPPGNEAAYRASVALPSTPPGAPWPDYQRRPALAPWRAAREALLRDADAPLPR